MSALLFLDAAAERGERLAVEVDPRHRGLGALENDVLGFLHVQVGLPQVVEHVGQHAGAIAMPHDQHVRRRRALREVDDVRHPAGLLVGADDADRLGGDGFLRLIGRRADVMRAVDARAARHELGRELGRWPTAGSLANTSSPARMPFSRTAAASAASSTTSPRAVLMKIAPGFNRAEQRGVDDALRGRVRARGAR